MLAGITDVVVGRFTVLCRGVINAIVPVGKVGKKSLEFLRRCGIIGLRYQRGKHGSAACSRRAARPPDMQRAQVAVPDRLLRGRSALRPP